MKGLKVTTIPEQRVETFNDGESLGFLNQFEINRLRIEVKDFYKGKPSTADTGLELLFDGQTIRIDSNGNLESWPRGLFDMLDNQLMVLIDWPQENS